jgi:hypothetical protein
MDRTAIALSYNKLAAKTGWPVYCDPSLSFDAQELKDLADILQGVRGARDYPARSDLTVRLMKAHVAHMTIYERDASKRWRVRLMGSHFARAYSDLTGKYLDEAVTPDRLPRFEATLDLALQAKGKLRFLAQADVVDREFLIGEYLVAPLANDNGEPTMVLSRVHFSRATGWESFLKAAQGRAASVAV